MREATAIETVPSGGIPVPFNIKTRTNATRCNRFPDRALIYNVAWKTLIYLVMSAFIHYLENLIDFWRKAGSFMAGNEKLLSEIVWPHFFAIQLILFVLILMYCTVHELIRVIGKEKFVRIFFGPMPAPEV